jgi:hypothetical protein
LDYGVSGLVSLGFPSFEEKGEGFDNGRGLQ